MSESREMYAEVNALVGAIAKALELSNEEAVKAIEDGRLRMAFGEDEAGHRFVEAAFEGRTSRIYQGAIRHGTDTDPDLPGKG